MANLITGLDIGSHSIKAVVVEKKKNGQLALLKLIKMPSSGMRRGAVDDPQEVTRSVAQVIAEIKSVSKSAARNIYLGVGSPDFRIQKTNGVVAVSRADSEIHRDDIERVTEAAQAVKFPLNRMPIHFILQEFIVDGVPGIKDPLGMVGNRLEVVGLIVDAFAPSIKGLSRCVENAGGSISGLIFSPLAVSRMILSRNQKDLGVVVVDIGFGKTGISVYEENKLLHSAVCPSGSGNVTNDLAVRLKASVIAAESIKLSLGSALAKQVPARETIELAKYDALAKGSATRRIIAETIELRLAEILEFVNNELKYINKLNHLPGGVMIVGGGAKLPAMADLARQELRLSAQIGVPNLSSFDLNSCDSASQAEDPEWSCAFGLVLSSLDQARESSGSKLGTGLFKKILQSFLP
ncbi:MAG: cell division protein FtsA [Candidatus Harrisonbacteria bacterium]|nr:cell division protein FtsA [Candidatus Harrisonbacteria bacterium]